MTTPREFLRLHLNAVWNLTIPAIECAEMELATDDALPPWSLYQARLPDEQVTLWRPGVAPDQRADLLSRAQRAGDIYDPALGMRREVALMQAGDQPPDTTPGAPPEASVRLLTAPDAALVEAFEAESSDYFLSAEHAPCIGVIVAERLVSVAHSPRRTPLACELGINTLPDARRQGYARAATLAWTRAIQQEGLLPIYSAFAWNTASLRLAASTGYTPIVAGVYGLVSKKD